MLKQRERIKTIIDEHLSCTECGRLAWPCWLAYSEITHSEAVWCLDCFPEAALRGEFTIRKETES